MGINWNIKNKEEIMGLFNREKNQLPVWFMRQAGRYHDHYQGIKKNSNFMEMCKKPELACEVTMGPINEFDFDAAILFSDLLFPLEQLGLGLEYSPGPILHRHLTPDSLKDFQPIDTATNFYDFQKKALELLKVELPSDKTLLGFVGAPFTLYTYGVEGSHAGSLFKAKRGLYNGFYQNFCETLFPHLLENMFVQARGGADAICLFDTAAGELAFKDFKEFLLPSIYQITKAFRAEFPDTKIIYYTKHTSLEYLRAIEDDNIDVLGFDWRVNLHQAFKELPSQYMLQGNFDPCWLHLSWQNCEKNIEQFFSQIPQEYWERWIVGLGHGVLIETPQDNVRNFVQKLRQLTR